MKKKILEHEAHCKARNLELRKQREELLAANLEIREANDELRKALAISKEQQDALNERIVDLRFQYETVLARQKELRTELQSTQDSDDRIFAKQRDLLIRFQQIADDAEQVASFVLLTRAGYRTRTIFGERRIVENATFDHAVQFTHMLRRRIAEMKIDGAIPPKQRVSPTPGGCAK